jgi:ATP-dependent helicase/DNAse subunit B
MNSDLITVSRMRDFNACRRRHHIKYELGYRPSTTAEALTFGTLVHAGLEVWWQRGGDLPAAHAAVQKLLTAEVDEVIVAKVNVLLAGYDARWRATMSQFEVLAVEAEFRAPLRNPATGYPCRDLEVAGKLDVIVRKRGDGSVWFVEHKTSAEDLSSGSTYWQRLRMDPQVSVYYDGAKALGHDVRGCIYDVLAKPRERLKLATPEAVRKYKKDGTLYANQREADETIDEFRDRITATMAESPDGYFGRAEVIRTEAELIESAKDTHATALMIRECERTGRNPRNPDACFLPGRTCPFHDVCCGLASLDDETRFVRLENPHPELGNDNNQ